MARSVFIIDREGIIRYRDVRRIGLIRPKDDEIIRAIRDAQGSPLPWTGDFKDGLGNLISVMAYANPPDIADEKQRADGYGIVRFQKKARKIIFECWPRFSDAKQGDKAQFPGWPITVDMDQNDGRKVTGYLPQLIKQLDHKNDDVVHFSAPVVHEVAVSKPCVESLANTTDPIAALLRANQRVPDDIGVHMDTLERLVGRNNSTLVNRAKVLQRQLEDSTKRIDFLTVTLTKQRERLTAQFYNMELAISKIKSNLQSIEAIKYINPDGTTS